MVDSQYATMMGSFNRAVNLGGVQKNDPNSQAVAVSRKAKEHYFK
jgi:hypothetical protein